LELVELARIREERLMQGIIRFLTTLRQLVVGVGVEIMLPQGEMVVQVGAGDLIMVQQELRLHHQPKEITVLLAVLCLLLILLVVEEVRVRQHRE
jgi:hypothetical protein